MDLSQYGIQIERAQGSPVFRLTKIEKLSGRENSGNHHVYVRVWDRDGKRFTPNHLRIAANGLYYSLDKPNGVLEKGHGNVPMWESDTYAVSLYDGGQTVSDVAVGLHTRHRDEEPGNTWGHHSFYLEFTLTDANEPEPPEDVVGIVKAVQEWIDEGANLLMELERVLS